MKKENENKFANHDGIEELGYISHLLQESRYLVPKIEQFKSQET